MSWRNAISKNIRELRIHFCQTSPESNGLRTFVSQQYLNLKKDNPKLPILIREAAGVEPRIFAQYNYGVERKIAVPNMTPESIEQKLKSLVENIPKEALK
ncbi:thioredoxin-like protein [Paraphysoderma sedebokerense]|nr:thioredoxin-like protein [Paraphysoderma sedebokerense]